MAAQTDFAIIPTQEELDRINRELRFFPVDNPAPATLTAAQLEDYNREGYLKGFRVYSEAEIAAIRGEFDKLLAQYMAEGKDSYSISSAHLKHAVAWDILTEPRIVAYVRDLLGEDVIGWGSHFFCKMPHDGKKVAWHQDASYWPLTPTKTCTVWLAIDDADEENACMQFLPGSHMAGHIAYEKSDATEGNVLDQTVTDVERYGAPVDDELRAGEMSIHADLLLHGSEANDSDRRRCGLTLRYCAADVEAHLGWNQKGVVVSGVDRSKSWANRERP
ncbi:MAG: phytanoyl-CoA dioxygenase family protein [Bryobacterales bacterium]|nr:phytanoyl-CoA dioxygenase family protein [Acidobacteriota bacterium]MCB9383292.1 phytanoyl-CoA dioxygenase family protein [Bryobacterales bacterium]